MNSHGQETTSIPKPMPREEYGELMIPIPRLLGGLLLASLLLAPVSITHTATPGITAGVDLTAHEISPKNGVIPTKPQQVGDLPKGSALRAGWQAFITSQGGRWRVWWDNRSGLPTLATGAGIPWVAGDGNDLKGPAPQLLVLEQLAREFISDHPQILGGWEGQIVLNRDISGNRGGGVWQVSFRQVVTGVPVDGSRLDFHLARGNLVAFGASLLGHVQGEMTPSLTAADARALLGDYLNLNDSHPFVDLKEPALWILPIARGTNEPALWQGAVGEGYDHLLVWRFTFADPASDPTWIGEVDARTGEIVSFLNDTRYDRVGGDVHPIKHDGDCDGGGCPQPGYPMPFADYSEAGGADQFTHDFGVYECASPDSTIETNLSGPYVWINDTCGVVSESAPCGTELDLGVSTGINCNVAAGSSPGNTDAARSSYYNISRVNQKARYWMPDNTWLNTPLEIRTNVNSTCNASWQGYLSMYRAGDGCANTGQVQGVVVHEWGHGLDQNDGGGYDSPSEAYADVVAIFESRDSCVGSGFKPGQNCTGYGDTCLDCTGIREMDWDRRNAHTPATPSGFVMQNCVFGGTSPCGKPEHCASHVLSETMYDLATRDLPASGLGADTSWQLAERLFYQSRPGSGGNAYNCSLPDSDSCGTTSWYHQLRLQDDDDGNLNNGTPHAAAFFAAFDRHDIACGAASDPENQSTSSCPDLVAPEITLTASNNSVTVAWNSVAGASSYRVYRNEHGCERSQVPLVEVSDPTVSWIDDELANSVAVHYRVEAIGSNSSCTGEVSTCHSSAAQPLAGRIEFSQTTYMCGATVWMQVGDSNHGGGSMTVTIASGTESTPETVVLTETSPGSSLYLGSIVSTSQAPAADGLLSTSDGDTITGEYIDADDGEGGTNISAQSTATVDCIDPRISDIGVENITGTSATIVWTTDEATDSELDWGEAIPPTIHEQDWAIVTSHDIALSSLSECTLYHYQVQSTDSAGNRSVDANGGQFFHFETYGDFGHGLQNCHSGEITLNTETYTCDDTVSFDLADNDLNQDPLLIETVVVFFSSTSEFETETVTATETDVNSSRFVGSISLSGGAPAPDGVLQVADGDLVTGTYRDADSGAGSASISFDTAQVDCAGPELLNLHLSDITDQRMTVSFDTLEPGDTVVEWGLTPSLGNEIADATLTTDHLVVLNQLDLCQRIFFRAKSTDTHGNTAVGELAGSPHQAHTWDIPGLYYRQTFEEGASDWTFTGEWEVGPPEGRGGLYGHPDPDEAYNNSAVAGNDLTGLGNRHGDYQDLADETATTPVLDAQSWTDTKLLLQRVLNVRTDDDASIAVINGHLVNTVYSSLGSNVLETEYSLSSYDLSSWVDGVSAVEIEFRILADNRAVFGDDGISSGWNIDDVILKDGTFPNFASCGGCETPPSYSGAISAVDNDACGSAGVTISWNAASAWGTGNQGSYAVYRDTTSGFSPSAGNLISSGITALAFSDTSAPTTERASRLGRSGTHWLTLWRR